MSKLEDECKINLEAEQVEYIEDHDIKEDEDEEAGNEEDSDESSSSDEGGRVALGIDYSQLTGGKGFPQNGHDYLKLVQTERKRIIISSKPPPYNPDKKKEKQQPSLVLSVVEPTDQTIVHDCNDLKYSSEIIHNFRRLRGKIEELRKDYTSAESDLDDDGGLSSEKQIDRLVRLSTKRADNLLKVMELGHPPQLRTIIDKSQMEIHMTLQKLTDQCEMTINTIYTDWIYSLMAALREPIEPDIYSTLRRIARLCIAKREAHKKNNEDLEEEEYYSSLLIICIVRHCFGQADLK